MKISFNCTDDQQVVHTHKDAGLSDQVPCSKPDISPEAYLNDYRNRMPFHYIEEGTDGYYYWQYGSIMDLVINFVDEIAQSEDMPEAVLDVRINDKSVVDPVSGIAHLGSMAERSESDYYTLQQTDKIVGTLSQQIKDLQEGSVASIVDSPENLMSGQLLMWDSEARRLVGSPLVRGDAEKSIILKTSSDDPNYAMHEGSVLFGKGLISSFPYQFVAGYYNKITPEEVFSVGAGFSNKTRSTAFSISRSGRVKVFNSPVDKDEVVRKQELDAVKEIADNAVVANEPIIAGTHTKITYDSKGLVTSGSKLIPSDIPELDTSKITSGVFSDDRIASADIWNAKQDALTEAQLSAVDSGITSTKVATYDGYVEAIDKKLDKTGGTVNGSLIISENLIVNGTTSTVDTQNLRVADKLIYVAKDNSVPLTSPAGIITPKYDGTNSGGIVYDNTGTAYVGDIILDANGNVDVVNSDLQPIATRNSTIIDGNLTKWDNNKKTLVDSGKKIDDLSTATNLGNGEGTGSVKLVKGGNTARGAFAFAFGWYANANGASTFAGGSYSMANVEYSISCGISTRTENGVLAAFGWYNNPTSGDVFEVGNGTVNDRSNAFAVLSDGRAKVYGTPREDNDVLRRIDIPIENGTGPYSLVQKYVKDNIDHSPVATGIDSVAFGGLRFDYDPEKHAGDTTNTAAGNQSFVAGCGNYTAGDWSFVTGKDNTVYSNRAFVSGGANISQAIDSEGNLIEEKTNVGRFNAIFGNNNTFKSSKTSKESNLIAGGSNTVDTERSIVVGYNNNVNGSFDAIFGFTNVINADYSLTGGRNHIVNGGFHLVAGSGNEVSGQYNIASGQDNNNAGWTSAVIGKGLIVGEDHTAQTILGQYNDNKSDTVLEIGWGDVDNRKNIFEVYRDGVVKTEKGTLSTEEYARNYTDNVVASLKKLKKLNIGTDNTDAEADNSLTVGQHSLNRGAKSAAIGWDAYVGYDSSGNPISTRPTGAIALGWSRANADYSLSAGYDIEVNHQWSAALNNKTKTGTPAQTVVGSYNAAKDDTAFEVGNGTSESDRKNAFEVLKDGRAKVQSAPVDDEDIVRKIDLDTAVAGMTTPVVTINPNETESGYRFNFSATDNFVFEDNGIYLLEVNQMPNGDENRDVVLVSLTFRGINLNSGMPSAHCVCWNMKDGEKTDIYSNTYVYAYGMGQAMGIEFDTMDSSKTLSINPTSITLTRIA